MSRPLFSEMTLPFNAGPQESGLDLRIDALRLAIDVHLATLQLPESERPYLGEELHTTARSIARRLARGRVPEVSRRLSRCQRAAARLVYLLRLARDLRWLSTAVTKGLEERAEDLRGRLARESLTTSPPRRALDATATPQVSIDELATVAMVVSRGAGPATALMSSPR